LIDGSLVFIRLLFFYINAMKYIYLLAFLTTRFITFGQVNKSAFSLQGILKNYSGDSTVVVRKPVNGLYNSVSFQSIDTIKIRNNEFSIAITCIKPVFFLVEVHGEYLNIIATPGGSLQVILDFSTLNTLKKAVCSFYGSNAQGHSYFHKYNYAPALKYERIWSIIKNAKAETFQSEFRKEMRKQMAPFDSLFRNNTIEEGYYDLVCSTIKMWLLIETIRRIGDFNLLNVAIKEKSKRIAIVKSLFLLFSPQSEFVFYGKNSIYYTQLYYSFKRALRTNTFLYNQPDSLIAHGSKKFVLTGVFAAICEIEVEKLREFVFASYLIDALSVQLEEVLKDEIIYFKYVYPDSPFIPVIETIQVAKRKERFQAENDRIYFSELNPEIVDTSEIYEDFSFDDDDRFRDKLIYVDIWATWCGPCLKEMEFNFRADSLLYSNDIKRIYISIDNPSQKEKWKEIIFQKHLGGYHILAGKELYKVLAKTVGFSEGIIAIPRYMFIKNGKVLVADAARPSDFNMLKYQLLELSVSDLKKE